MTLPSIIELIAALVAIIGTILAVGWTIYQEMKGIHVTLASFMEKFHSLGTWMDGVKEDQNKTDATLAVHAEKLSEHDRRLEVHEVEIDTLKKYTRGGE